MLITKALTPWRLSSCYVLCTCSCFYDLGPVIALHCVAACSINRWTKFAWMSKFIDQQSIHHLAKCKHKYRTLVPFCQFVVVKSNIAQICPVSEACFLTLSVWFLSCKHFPHPQISVYNISLSQMNSINVNVTKRKIHIKHKSQLQSKYI